MAADVTSGGKVAEMTDIEKLEAQKQKKRQEMEDLIANLRESAQGEQLSPKAATKADSEEVQMKWQAVQQMQTQLAEKKLFIQTVLEEIKESMPLVKELQVRASKNDEDAILQIKALQEEMKGRKETLEEAAKEMEELSANMREIQSQAHS